DGIRDFHVTGVQTCALPISTLNVYPGINFGFSQPIMDNVEEYVAGVKSSLVAKVYGDDLYKLEQIADSIAKSLNQVKGIEDLLRSEERRVGKGCRNRLYRSK